MQTVRAVNESFENERETGYTTFEKALTQNAWTMLVGHSNKRKGLHLTPTDSYVVLSFGNNAPIAVPTVITPMQFVPPTLNKHSNPAMLRGPVWAYTNVASVTMIVTEEMDDSL